MSPHDKIAKILRADKGAVLDVEKKLSAITGKNGVIEKIIEENEAAIRNRLDSLGLGRNLFAKNVYDALISKIESDDNKLFEAMGRPICDTQTGCAAILESAKKLAADKPGFFLKKEKAEELLRNEPPKKIIQYLGYKDVDELLAREELLEVFSALRFLEGSDWLNQTFFKQYEKLKPSDFEERKIIIKSLGPQWAAAANAFVAKKYHNISHLKELGVIFVIPVSLGISGELIRNFSLILHYLNEVPFYSDLFKMFAANETSFSNNLISLLRGDVIDKRLAPSEKSRWLIIQRYLAKDDENDWRLFEPHVNPEALHWARAERLLVKSGDLLDGFSGELAFWQNLSWVGDYFPTEAGIDILASFNIVDTAMSLVKEKELIKYLYHHQESLWNKIFCEYFGEEKMEELMKKNIVNGWFEI
ncbi:hypothetical protein HZB06_01110 [Candidatus Wolfebacteria bacterium]|nr:hypothetical protein [Candidatus Wolfebacteria bacterium]